MVDASPPARRATPLQACWRRLWWLPAVGAAALAYRTVGGFDFVGDARFLIADNRFVTDLSYLWQTLTRDYFWASSGNGIPYWRPVTKLSWLLEYQLFGRDAGGYHWLQLAWFLVGVVGVQLLARAGLGLARAGALLAGVLFALHPVAVEPVCLIMARSDVVAATSAIWAALGWWRWRTSGRWGWAVLHAIALVLALGSKESSVALLPLLAVVALLAGDIRAGQRAQLLKLLPVAIATGAYLAARNTLLQGTGAPAIGWEPLRWLAAAASYLWGLLPFRLSPPLRSIPHAEALSAPFLLLAAGSLLAVAAAAVLAIRRRAWAPIALLAWIALSLGPVILSHQIHVPGTAEKFVVADRWLLHALAPAALLLAWLFARAPGRVARTTAFGATALWAILALALAPRVRAGYATDTTMLAVEDAGYEATPVAFRSAADTCAYHERRAIRAIVGSDRARAIPLLQELLRRCGETPERLFNLLSAFVQEGRFREAEPIARHLLAKRIDHRHRAALCYLAARTYFALGQPQLAVRLLERARLLGISGPHVDALFARARAAAGTPR